MVMKKSVCRVAPLNMPIAEILERITQDMTETDEEMNIGNVLKNINALLVEYS